MLRIRRTQIEQGLADEEARLRRVEAHLRAIEGSSDVSIQDIVLKTTDPVTIAEAVGVAPGFRAREHRAGVRAARARRARPHRRGRCRSGPDDRAGTSSRPTKAASWCTPASTSATRRSRATIACGSSTFRSSRSRRSCTRGRWRRSSRPTSPSSPGSRTAATSSRAGAASCTSSGTDRLVPQRHRAPDADLPVRLDRSPLPHCAARNPDRVARRR